MPSSPPHPSLVQIGGLYPDGDAPISPWPSEELERLIRGRPLKDPTRINGLGWVTQAQQVMGPLPNFASVSQQQFVRERGLVQGQKVWGLLEGLDTQDLSQTGWALVLPPGPLPDEANLLDALSPLLQRRAAQAGPLFKQLRWTGDEARLWRANFGQGQGAVDPNKLPYYLLLLGNPEHIPFRLQLDLSVQYAVGRLPLMSRQALRNYADTVVAAEEQKLRRPHRVGFFGPDPDPFTALSRNNLVQPLAQDRASHKDGWTVQEALGEQATRATLRDWLSPQGPGLVFAATHGQVLTAGAPEQQRAQGALLCQDWPGRPDKVAPEHLLRADDLHAGPAPHGLIAFFFACFSGGTPTLDLIGRQLLANQGLEPAARVAPQEFVAALPQAMLSHPDGPALAVIGHVDRTTSASFIWADNDLSPPVAELTQFQGFFNLICQDEPVGAAMDPFARWSAEKHLALAKLVVSPKSQPGLVASTWSAANDSESWVILGDPAVRACADGQAQQTLSAPTITLEAPEAELALVERLILACFAGGQSPVTLYRQAGRRALRAMGITQAQQEQVEQALSGADPSQTSETWKQAYRAAARQALLDALKRP